MNGEGGIRLLVLDVLKPHQPMVTDLALGLSELEGGLTAST